ncbi:MAG: hypothetical protein ACRED4_03810, partial [Brevundimonas sp.]
MTITQTPPRLWSCAALPLWVRVTFYARENHRRDLNPGELRTALGEAHARHVSRAIRRAIDLGASGPDSTA